MLLIAGMFFVIALEAVLLVLVNKAVADKINIFVNKKKGLKKFIVVHSDDTISTHFTFPEVNNQFKIGKREHTIEKGTVMFDRNDNIQALMVGDNSQFTFKPLSEKEDTVDPQYIELSIFQAFQLGMEAGKKETELLKTLLMITVLAAIAGVFLGYINMQTLNTLAHSLAQVPTTL